MKKIIILFCLSFILFNTCFAQPFTHADTLRGSNGAGRSWWDATKYDLHVKFNLQDSTISGYNIISFKALSVNEVMNMQIDLQEPMVIDSILDGPFKIEKLRKDGNAYPGIFCLIPGPYKSAIPGGFFCDSCFTVIIN